MQHLKILAEAKWALYPKCLQGFHWNWVSFELKTLENLNILLQITQQQSCNRNSSEEIILLIHNEHVA